MQLVWTRTNLRNQSEHHPHKQTKTQPVRTQTNLSNQYEPHPHKHTRSHLVWTRTKLSNQYEPHPHKETRWPPVWTWTNLGNQSEPHKHKQTRTQPFRTRTNLGDHTHTKTPERNQSERKNIKKRLSQKNKNEKIASGEFDNKENERVEESERTRTLIYFIVKFSGGNFFLLFFRLP